MRPSIRKRMHSIPFEARLRVRGLNGFHVRSICGHDDVRAFIVTVSMLGVFAMAQLLIFVLTH